MASEWQILVSLSTEKTVKLRCLFVNSVLWRDVVMETMAKVWMAITVIIVSYTWVYVGDWGETGQDSHLCFSLLSYLGFFADHAIVLQKGKFNTQLQHDLPSHDVPGCWTANRHPHHNQCERNLRECLIQPPQASVVMSSHDVSMTVRRLIFSSSVGLRNGE